MDYALMKAAIEAQFLMGHCVPSGAWRKSVSNAFHQIACKNNAFPRAKLARHLRCAALVGTSRPTAPPSPPGVGTWTRCASSSMSPPAPVA